MTIPAVAPATFFRNSLRFDIVFLLDLLRSTGAGPMRLRRHAMERPDPGNEAWSQWIGEEGLLAISGICQCVPRGLPGGTAPQPRPAPDHDSTGRRTHLQKAGHSGLMRSLRGSDSGRCGL